MGSPDLSLGLIAFDRRADVDAIEGARAVGRSLLLCEECAPSCPNRAESYYAGVFEGTDPVIVRDLQQVEIRTDYELRLREHGHRSLLLYPLYVDDQLVGLMELASPESGDLNAFNARRLVDVVPLFATALKRNLDGLEDRVQAVIKRKYTAIHSSVEWRFRDPDMAALGYLEGLEGGAATMNPQPTQSWNRLFSTRCTRSTRSPTSAVHRRSATTLSGLISVNSYSWHLM